MSLAGLLLGYPSWLWAQAAEPVADTLVLAQGEMLQGRVIPRKNPVSQKLEVVFDDSLVYPVTRLRAFTHEGALYVRRGTVRREGARAEVQERILRRVLHGRIDVYTDDTRPGNPRAATRTSLDFFSQRTSSVQEVGFLHRVTYENLKPIFADHAHSRKRLQASRRWQRVQHAIAGTGLALVGYGLYQTGKQALERPPGELFEFRSYRIPRLTFVGVGVSFCSRFPRSVRHQKLRQAIEIYNAR